ncbi:hypothetical protein GGR54DRAFT_298563 [Hypoxylon sp. NC1633]|nr:hypothetical protein GGR54DRAFT_298563 [Hypoxylon sp. NC1633]
MSVADISEVYSFPTEFIENLYVLPNGHLLLSTFQSPGLLYTIDPTAKEPLVQPVTSFDSNITGLTGIVHLEGDLYAISGGLHKSFSFERGSMSLFIVSLETGGIIDSIPVPDTATMNGLATLPHNPHIVLSADSIDGRILAIDTRTKEVSVLLSDPALSPGSGDILPGVPPIGINGLRARGEHLYFTNSAQGTFARVRIDADSGSPAGNVEVLARSPAADQIYDDFAFDREGNAFIAVHPASVVRVAPDGAQTIVAGAGAGVGGELGGVALRHPTSVALDWDGSAIYVSTGGNLGAEPREGGQVVRIVL